TATNTTLSAHDDVTNSSTASVGTTSLTANSTSGSIGTGTRSEVCRVAANLIATASGSAFLRDTNATGVSINGASSADSTSGTFNLVADNALSFTSAGTIGAHDVLLTSTNKGLSFAGAITAINTTLTAHDDIIDSSTASVGTTSLTVNSTSGSIGTGT